MNTYINAEWKFIEGFLDIYPKKCPREAIDIDLPHPARMMPYHCFSAEDYQGVFTYFKTFDAPNDRPVQLLVFEGAMLQFDAYLNGEYLGHFISGYLPVTIDISKQIKRKSNYLVVRLDSKEDPAIPPFGKVVDYMTFAGIYRKVRIESHPSSYIKDAFIEASAEGEVNIRLDTVGEAPFLLEILEGKKIVLTTTETTAQLEKAKRWSVDRPNLYEFRLHYGEDIRIIHTGFRSIKVQEDGLYINGERIKIRGLNRHQTYPYVGAAAPDAMQIDDARILKNKLGVNLVRTSHYPQDESFLSECDRLGLLVIDEIPGWQYVSEDPIWRENCKDFAKRMILKERNHPSVIMYGLRIDESVDDHRLYSEIQSIKKELDNTRPSIGVRYFKGSELLEDVYGYNDFNPRETTGLDSSKSYRKEKGKPKLVTEHNGHMYPTKSTDPTERRAEQAFRHLAMINDAYKDERLLGAIGWCAFDYNTHKTFGNMDHICYHGVCDIFRNPKYAAFAYASQAEEPFLEIGSSLQTSDFNAALLPIAYIYSNCDTVKAFVNGKLIGELEKDTKRFPNLPHPPFILDDIVGDRIDEKFTAKDKKKVAKAFSYIAHNGMSKVKLGQGLLLLKIMLKYHYSYPDLYQMYGKYVVGWGSDGVVFEFVGYKDGKEVIRKKRGPSGKYALLAKATKTTLKYENVYDVARVTVSCFDEFGTVSYLSDELLELEVGDGLRILGPSKANLVGGQISIYVAGEKVRKPRESLLKIKGARQSLEIPFEVA